MSSTCISTIKLRKRHQNLRLLHGRLFFESLFVVQLSLQTPYFLRILSLLMHRSSFTFSPKRYSSIHEILNHLCVLTCALHGSFGDHSACGASPYTHFAAKVAQIRREHKSIEIVVYHNTNEPFCCINSSNLLCRRIYQRFEYQSKFGFGTESLLRFVLGKFRVSATARPCAAHTVRMAWRASS